jgi:sarcosine oxidase, subunit gamma
MSGQQLPASVPPRYWPLGSGTTRESSGVRFEDCCARVRFGCKGPEAPAWLSRCGYTVPSQPNHAHVDGRGILVARLALSEFLIEAVDGGAEAVATSVAELLWSATPTGVYPVVRQDLVLSLAGSALNTLLRQICSVDFSSLLERAGSDAGPVVLTSMIGVGVIAWPRRTASGAALTLWLDPSFGHYFCTTLLEVAAGIAGTPERGDRDHSNQAGHTHGA